MMTSISLCMRPNALINLLTEGVNGILPNLDLVNVVVYLCHSENMNVAFQSKVSEREREGENSCMNLAYLHVCMVELLK